MRTDTSRETKPCIPIWKSLIKRWSIYFIVGSAAAMISGQLGVLDWRFEITCHFVPFYLIATALATALLAAIRSWRWVFAGSICVLINLIAMAPCYLPAPNRAADSTQHNLRILHANILTSNGQHQTFLDYITETDPDIICVQEINQAWVSALSELKERYPHTTIHSRTDNFGIAIYSKLKPTTNPRIISPAQTNVPAIQTAFKVGETEFNLINIHTLPPVSTSYRDIRNQQLAHVAEIANKWKNPGIIIGDLNTTPWSPCYRAFKKQTHYINTSSGFGLCVTWPCFSPLTCLPLDHIFVHPTIQVVKYTVGPDIGSDHRPVLVDLFLSSKNDT